jgi:hypothetical protein
MDPHRKLKIGNLNKSSLEELWNDPLIRDATDPSSGKIQRDPPLE